MNERDPFELADYDPVLAALAEPHSAPPPDGLRDVVLRAARATRTPSITVGELGVIASAPECYRELVTLLGGVLDELGAEVWATTARPYRWSCHELVAHLLAVERYTASLAGGAPFTAPEGTEADHLAFGRDVIAAETQRRPADTVADWRSEAAALADRAATLDSAAAETVIAFNGVPMRVDTLWKARSFELWAHMDDLCLAGGLELRTPSPAVLRSLSSTSVESLPLVLAFTGAAVSTSHARIVLTGAGGGAYSILLGDASAADEPATTIVADVVDYCRMAARRLDRRAVHGRIHGDGTLASRLMDAAQALAV